MPTFAPNAFLVCDRREPEWESGSIDVTRDAARDLGRYAMSLALNLDRDPTAMMDGPVESSPDPARCLQRERYQASKRGHEGRLKMLMTSPE